MLSPGKKRNNNRVRDFAHILTVYVFIGWTRHVALLQFPLNPLNRYNRRSSSSQSVDQPANHPVSANDGPVSASNTQPEPRARQYVTSEGYKNKFQSGEIASTGSTFFPVYHVRLPFVVRCWRWVALCKPQVDIEPRHLEELTVGVMSRFDEYNQMITSEVFFHILA